MARTVPDAREQKRMLAFAIRWMPYGGGPAEDIVVTFGVSPRTYFSRLNYLLTNPDLPVELDTTTVGALREICHRRL